MTARYILAVSDLHCGSTVGIMPRRYKSLKGNVVLPNRTQEQMADIWDDVTGEAMAKIGNEPFILAVLGDCIQGRIKRETDVWTDNFNDQAQASIDLLMPFASQAQRTYLVTGTESHTHDVEEPIGIALGVTPDEHGSFAPGQIDLIHQSGYAIRLVHHLPTSLVSRLQIGALGRYLHDARHNALEAREEGIEITVPDFIAGGNRHKPGAAVDGKRVCVSLPPWQGLNRYAQKVCGTEVPKFGVDVFDLHEIDTHGRPGIHEYHRPYAQFGSVSL